MRYSINRIDEKIAVCEDDNGVIVEIYLSDLYDNPKEGDVIKKDGDKFLLDEDETAERRKKIIALQNSLFE